MKKAPYCLVKLNHVEPKDCTVIATQMCLGLSYKEAHEKMAKIGRKPNRGYRYRIAAPILGLEVRTDLVNMTVGTALKSLQSGRFVIRVKRHVFAVVDGRMFDTVFTNTRKRVMAVYEAPMDNPVFLKRYPYLEMLARIDKLPDMRAINCH